MMCERSGDVGSCLPKLLGICRIIINKAREFLPDQKNRGTRRAYLVAPNQSLPFGASDTTIVAAFLLCLRSRRTLLSISGARLS